MLLMFVTNLLALNDEKIELMKAFEIMDTNGDGKLNK